MSAGKDTKKEQAKIEGIESKARLMKTSIKI